MIKIGDLIEGRLSMNTSGSGYLVSEDLPKDIYIHKTNMNRALHLDTISIEVVKGKGKARKIEGKVVEVKERFKEEFVGTLQVNDRFAFLVPDSNKMVTDIFIPLKYLNGGVDGQKAVAKITNWKEDAKSPKGEVVEVLGYAGDNEAEIHSILHEYNLPYKFPIDVEDEAKLLGLSISPKEIESRRDMRNILTFTIDGPNSKDFDDALSVEWVGGNMLVGVHIADVSHYVRPNTELYKEALHRGTSVYLVDRVVPMLPEVLSNGVCSLNPNEDRLTFSFYFTLDKDGNVISETFEKSVIHSNYRLTYGQVQEVIEGGDMEDKELKQALLDLDRYAKIRRKKRTKNSLSFNKREVNFKLDENNKPTGIYFVQQKDSNKLIEEFMVLTNQRVCKYLTESSNGLIHRAHESPDMLKLQNIKNLVSTFGYNLNLNDPDNIKVELNKLLEHFKGSPYEMMLDNLIVRSQKKAVYQKDNIGHWGLGLEHYTHITSPIRRFCDLKNHEILYKTLPNNGYPIR